MSGDPIQAIAFAGTGIRARLNLWFRDKNCYWCGRETILFIPYTREQRIEANTLQLNATKDHVPNGGDWLVNGCNECNGLRNCLAFKQMGRKHISHALFVRSRPVLELWLRIGRPETVQLANYVFSQPFIHLTTAHTAANRRRRRQLLTIMTYQMMQFGLLFSKP